MQGLPMRVPQRRCDLALLQTMEWPGKCARQLKNVIEPCVDPLAVKATKFPRANCLARSRAAVRVANPCHRAIAALHCEDGARGRNT